MMFFGRKDKNRDRYEDPVTEYGRLLRQKDRPRREPEDKSSFLSWLFGSGHDSDFVYYDD
jgi:hypothetical protein